MNTADLAQWLRAHFTFSHQRRSVERGLDLDPMRIPTLRFLYQGQQPTPQPTRRLPRPPNKTSVLRGNTQARHKRGAGPHHPTARPSTPPTRRVHRRPAAGRVCAADEHGLKAGSKPPARDRPGAAGGNTNQPPPTTSPHSVQRGVAACAFPPPRRRRQGVDGRNGQGIATRQRGMATGARRPGAPGAFMAEAGSRRRAPLVC